MDGGRGSISIRLWTSPSAQQNILAMGRFAVVTTALICAALVSSLVCTLLPRIAVHDAPGLLLGRPIRLAESKTLLSRFLAMVVTLPR
jgi:hypothetical protein